MEEEIEFYISVRKLCKQYNILFIADEVRVGSCKTGRFLSSDWMGPEHKPDMVTMGKSISGGVWPTSFVFGPDEVMNKMKPYQSVSTFSMSSMAVTAVTTALQVFFHCRFTKKKTCNGGPEIFTPNGSRRNRHGNSRGCGIVQLSALTSTFCSTLSTKLDLRKSLLGGFHCCAPAKASLASPVPMVAFAWALL